MFPESMLLKSFFENSDDLMCQIFLVDYIMVINCVKTISVDTMLAMFIGEVIVYI